MHAEKLPFQPHSVPHDVVDMETCPSPQSPQASDSLSPYPSSRSSRSIAACMRRKRNGSLIAPWQQQKVPRRQLTEGEPALPISRA
eukprot:765966-Hanusia_phi.AAC.3